MHADCFPVHKSFLSVRPLADKIADEYGFANVTCQLLAASMRDIYLVRADALAYIFVLYRADQRRVAEIRGEWQFVDYLAEHRMPVAPAIQTRQNKLLLTFNLPEGKRHGVLTPFIEGKHLRHRPSEKAAGEYGRIIAQIHRLADEMAQLPHRPKIDLPELLLTFVVAFAKVFPERNNELSFLKSATAQIISQLATLQTDAPAYGLIHGDVIRANALVSDNGSVSVIDFDLCGYGWRAYDIASFLAVGQDIGETFLEGYTAVRPLSGHEQSTIPLFKAVRAIFSLAIPIMSIDHWGLANILPWLDESLARIEQSMLALG